MNCFCVLDLSIYVKCIHEPNFRVFVYTHIYLIIQFRLKLTSYTKALGDSYYNLISERILFHNKHLFFLTSVNYFVRRYRGLYPTHYILDGVTHFSPAGSPLPPSPAATAPSVFVHSARTPAGGHSHGRCLPAWKDFTFDTTLTSGQAVLKL